MEAEQNTVSDEGLNNYHSNTVSAF